MCAREEIPDRPVKRTIQVCLGDEARLVGTLHYTNLNKVSPYP